MSLPVVNWAAAESLVFDDASPAKNVEGKATINLKERGFKKIIVQVSIAFAAGVDGNSTITVKNSCDAGVTIDTVDYDSKAVTFNAGNTEIVTMAVPAYGKTELPFVQIGVLNGTSTEAEITISAKFVGLKIDADRW